MEEERSRIAEAIRRLREGVHWRPEKDVQHLAKRIELGHLPGGTTVADYEALILRVRLPLYRPYAEGNLSGADGLSYDAHERILA